MTRRPSPRRFEPSYLTPEQFATLKKAGRGLRDYQVASLTVDAWEYLLECIERDDAFADPRWDNEELIQALTDLRLALLRLNAVGQQTLGSVTQYLRPLLPKNPAEASVVIERLRISIEDLTEQRTARRPRVIGGHLGSAMENLLASWAQHTNREAAQYTDGAGAHNFYSALFLMMAKIDPPADFPYQGEEFLRAVLAFQANFGSAYITVVQRRQGQFAG